MELSLLQDLFGIASGAVVGFALGLVGGGGSILAVPLMIYLVGVSSPHVAIGTSATAVAVSASLNLANHARSGIVKWRCASVFAAAGTVGALGGSTLGKSIDGQSLLAVFAVLMAVIAGLLLWRRRSIGDATVSLAWHNLPKLVGLGFAAGGLSGFFGIGGGFLIVPALMAATGMPIINAIGSSLVAVTAFGVTTAANYELSGFVDWPLTILFVIGGLVGGLIGANSARLVSLHRGGLNAVFATAILLVAVYMFVRSTGLA